MTEEEARKMPFNPFDLTKVWPHKDFPLIDVGVMELNRNPENYFADVEQAASKEPPLKLEGDADHYIHREDDDDYYSQPGALFRLMRDDEKKRLFENTARNMGDAPRMIKIRHIGNCLKADEAYGKGVAEALGIPLSEVK